MCEPHDIHPSCPWYHNARGCVRAPVQHTTLQVDPLLVCASHAPRGRRQLAPLHPPHPWPQLAAGRLLCCPVGRPLRLSGPEHVCVRCWWCRLSAGWWGCRRWLPCADPDTRGRLPHSRHRHRPVDKHWARRLRPRPQWSCLNRLCPVGPTVSRRQLHPGRQWSTRQCVCMLHEPPSTMMHGERVLLQLQHPALLPALGGSACEQPRECSVVREHRQVFCLCW